MLALTIGLFATNGVGLLGYCVGPGTAIIDNMALTDPLLARLPITDPAHWRIGHFYRAIPAGYWRAIKTGDSSAMEPAVARLGNASTSSPGATSGMPSS